MFRKKANIANCLQTIYPEIAHEWNYKKNALTPFEVLPGSSKKVWWTCRKGHNYECIISGRTRGNGCPYCANKKADMENCLQTVYPNIALEWDYNKNDLKPLPLHVKINSVHLQRPLKRKDNSLRPF